VRSAILATAWLLEVLVQTESAHNDSTVNVFEMPTQKLFSLELVNLLSCPVPTLHLSAAGTHRAKTGSHNVESTLKLLT